MQHLWAIELMHINSSCSAIPGGDHLARCCEGETKIKWCICVCVCVPRQHRKQINAAKKLRAANCELPRQRANIAAAKAKRKRKRVAQNVDDSASASERQIERLSVSVCVCG